MKVGKRILSIALSTVIAAGTWLTGLTMTAKADTIDPSSLFTSYQPVITEVTDSNGFIHPGVGLTKEILDNVRAEVIAKNDPWYTYFKGMVQSRYASKTVSFSNQSSSDTSKPAVVYFNSQNVEAKFIHDALIAYTQALMFYFTGDNTYRANALHVIRLWSQMDPTQYAYYTDACIHTGIPLNRMVSAAEILRYTSYDTTTSTSGLVETNLAWTDADTANFTNNLINPVINTFQHDNNHFMNQHTYPLLGAMAGYIFTSNKARYDEAVEWFTVNSTATDQGFNGSVKQLFRLVTTEDQIGEKVGTGTPVAPQVQDMEMGRDNAHASGDLTNATYIADMMLAQGTKVDPTSGTVSTDSDAVGPYEFLNDRILAGANYFFRYCLGYDTPWIPVAYSIATDGTVRDMYYYVSESYRGRLTTSNCWQLYYYYTYTRGWTTADWEANAPYFYQAFVKRLPPMFYYYNSLNNDWDGSDGGGDWWLYIPKAAESEGSSMLPPNNTTATREEIEEHYTALDGNSSTVTEGDTTFIRMNATQAGAKIALFNQGVSGSIVGFRIRTNGVARMTLQGINTFTLPNTNNKWVYVTDTFGANQGMGDMQFLTVQSDSDTTVDIDNIDTVAGTDLTPPTFKLGSDGMNVYTYVGAPMVIDFSATDAGTSDVVTYGLTNPPDGSTLDVGTGQFSWTPSKDGTYTFVVTASDGTTTQAKTVTINVSENRASAVQETIAPYNANTPYEFLSLQAYQAAYDQTMSMINTATDLDFTTQLQALRTAVLNLKLVTPTLSDGTLDYTNICTSPQLSSANIKTLTDGNVSTHFSYMSAPNLYVILDFGVNYKVKATKFGFQSDIFADRLAGSNVYGSNDGVTWTKLTDTETAFTQAYQTVNVDPQYQDVAYRYFKIQEDNPQPDIIHNAVQNMLEISEFRIYGTRYETGIVDSLSMSAPNSLNGVVSIGNPINFSLKTKKPVKDVSLKVQGVYATVTETDSQDWTATVILPSGTQTGNVRFNLEYTGADGTVYDDVNSTTDGSSLLLVDASKYINVELYATVTASDPQWPGNGLSASQVGYLLFDGDITTYGDLNTQGSNKSYYIIDFGANSSVQLDQILLMPRSSAASRMNGTVIQGSNDGTDWTNITNPVTVSTVGVWTNFNSSDMLDHDSYRYIRIYNDSAWYGNVSEVLFYGNFDTTAANLASRITSIPATSRTATSITMPAMPSGYSVSVKSTSPSGIIGSDGTILVQPDEDTVVNTVFTVTKASDGSTADTSPIKVLVSGKNAPSKIDVALLASVTASSGQWVQPNSGTTPLSAAQEGALLFDGDTTNSGDLSAGNGYYTVDFGVGATVSLREVRFFPRSNSSAYNAARLNGAIISGSNDGSTWTQLTQPVSGASINNWVDQRLDQFLDTGSYRYFKISNPSNTGWHGNIAEVEFYGDYSAPAQTLASMISSVKSLSATDTQLTMPTMPAGYSMAIKSVSPVGIIGTDGSVTHPMYDTTVSIVFTVTAPDGTTADTAAIKVGVPGTMASSKIDVASLAIVTASDKQWVQPGSTTTPLTAAQEGALLFDGDTTTAGDLATATGTYTVDFGIGASVKLSEVRMMPRTGNAFRLNGAHLMGSNDGTNWVNLTPAVSGATDSIWVAFKLSDLLDYNGYRYFMLCNSSNWYGNVAEVEFYGYVNYQLQSVNLLANTTTLYQTQTEQLSLAGTYLNGKAADLSSASVTYSSSCPTIVSVDSNGVVTANSTGNADITATVVLNGTTVQTNAVTLTVLPILNNITATADKTLLESGNTAQVSVSGTMTDGTAADLSNATITYSSDNTAVATVDANGVVTAIGEGRTNITVSVTLNGFTQATAVVEPIVVDDNPPVTTATTDPQTADGSNGWFKSPVTVTLAATDTVTGVAKTEYSLDDGATWTAYTVPIQVKTDGTTVINYRSTDNAGHVEDAKTLTVNLDTTVPTIQITGVKADTYLDAESILPVVQLNDTTSGVDNFSVIALDGQTVQQGASIALYQLPLGKHTLTVTASDLAGNTATQTVTFTTTTSICSMKSIVSELAKGGMIDNSGVANSLLSKLSNYDLNAFVNELTAQGGKHVSTEAAGYLTRDAQYLIAQNSPV